MVDQRRFVLRSNGMFSPRLHPHLLWVSRDRIGGAARYGNHVHAHHELIVCERGVYRCRVAGGVVAAAPGEAVLVGPGDRHEDPLGGPVRYLACGFRLEPAAAGARSPAIFAPGADPVLRHLRGGDSLAALAVGLAAAVRRAPDAYGWAVLDASCAAWLWQALADVPAAALIPALRLQRADADAGERLRAAFALHLARPVGVGVLARAAGLSPRAFAAACRTHLGLPPLAAFRRARCEAAAVLLAQGESVAATAAHLGFANPFHFSRAFRAAMGEPPSHFQG